MAAKDLFTSRNEHTMEKYFIEDWNGWMEDGTRCGFQRGGGVPDPGVLGRGSCGDQLAAHVATIPPGGTWGRRGRSGEQERRLDGMARNVADTVTGVGGGIRKRGCWVVWAGTV